VYFKCSFYRCARDIVDKNKQHFILCTLNAVSIGVQEISLTKTKKKIILYTLNAVSIGVHEISLTKTKNVYLLLYSSL